MAFSTVRPKPRSLFQALGAALALTLAASGQAQIPKEGPETTLARSAFAPAAPRAGATRRAVRNDFLGTGKSSLLLRNPSTGDVMLSPMNGTQILPGQTIYNEASPSWSIVGSGDFNGDGISELLWWNSDTGTVQMMQLTAGGVLWQTPAYTATSTQWEVKAVADFDGDGKADILLRNTGTGEVWLQPMDGSNPLPGTMFYQENRPEWKLIGAADFDGDGKADVIWWNSQTGQVFLQFMDGGTVRTAGYLPTGLSADWMIAGIGDFNGDGQADIIWRNQNTGQLDMTLISGGQIVSHNLFTSQPDPAWQIAAIGDYDGDGKDDLLWMNSSTGAALVTLLNGATIATYGQGGSLAGPAWGSALPPVAPVIGKVFMEPASLAMGGTLTYTACFSGGTGTLSPGNWPVFSYQPLTIDPYAAQQAAAPGGRPRLTEAGPGTQATRFVLTVSNAGGVSASYRSELVVPSFTLMPYPRFLTAGQGGTTESVIFVDGINGFEDLVTFDVASAPPGWTCTWDSPSGYGGDFLTINVPASQTPGTYLVDVTGTSDGVTVHTILRVTVTLSSSLSLVAGPAPSTYGQLLSIGAFLSPIGADGTLVTFLDGPNIIGSAPLFQGQATFSSNTLNAGSHSFSALFPGGGGIPSAVSLPMPWTVDKANPTVVLSVPSPEVNQGDLVQVNVMVSGAGSTPTGTMDFYDNGNLLGTVSVNAGAAVWASTAFAAGSHSFTATYSGDSNYLTGTSGSGSLTVDAVVNLLQANLVVSSSQNPANSGDPVTITATVTGAGATPTGSVTFTGDFPMVVVPLVNGVASMPFTMAASGTYMVMASYSGDGTYATSPSPVMMLPSQVIN